MKIGIDIRNIGKGRTGDETVFFHLVKNLAKIDDVNEYFLFTDMTDNHALRKKVVTPLEIESKKNFQIVSLKCANKFIWNSWTLSRYLRRYPVDVYHTQYILPFFLPQKIKLVTTIHDISFNFYPQFIKATDLFFLKLLIPRTLKKAAHVIAVSDFTRSEIIKFYGTNPDKITTIANAANDTKSDKESSEIVVKRVKHKHKLPENFILYLGTFQPRKNLPQLIEAFKRVKSRHADLKLVLAGKRDYNYDHRIDTIIKANALKNDVLFPGYISAEDKKIVLHLAKVFVLPSLYEGFGIPVLEAMSQGVPVVVSDIPALRETAGQSALYFTPGNIDSLVDVLHNVLIDDKLRAKLSFEGKERVKFFSWERSARQMLSVYEIFKQKSN